MERISEEQSSELILASTSPRRIALLNNIQITFSQLSPNIIETIPIELDNPVDVARSIAYSKAISIDNNINAKYLITADTLVFLEQKIFGKPTSPKEAIQMLKELRGLKHKVVTAIALKSPNNNTIYIDHNVTDVTMREYSDFDIEKFVNSGSAFDKSGAYAIQDKGFRPVKFINGCYTNVLGLPICTTLKLLIEHGFIWNSELSLDAILADSICSIAESWDMEI